MRFIKRKYEHLYEIKSPEKFDKQGKPEPVSITGMSMDEIEEINIDIFEIIKYKVYQVAYGYANSLVITGQSGVGKCHTKGTKIRMYNGNIKKVEDIKEGDFIMGDDSTPRKVLSLYRGEDKLFKVIPKSNGFDSFGCNSNHILSLRKSKTNEVVNVSVRDYIKWSNWKKSLFNLYRVAIEYEYKKPILDSYFLGLWLGDGSSHNASIETMDCEISDYIYEYANDLELNVSTYGENDSRSNGYKITNGERGYSDDNFVINKLNEMNLLNNKHIPDLYMFNSIKERKKLLAGLIDSDGYMYNKCYEISTKWSKLATQIKYLCQSLGYRTWIKEKVINDKIYYIVKINGDLSDLPILLKRKQSDKRKQIKNVCHSGFELEEIGEGEYYGFSVDKNNLYCLHDYVVTHNSYDTEQALEETRKDYYSVSGGISTAGLFELLFRRNGEIILFDDCDSVFDNPDSINILKAALDSKPVRKISRELKTHFDTKGMTMKDIMANYLGDRSKADNPTLFKSSNEGKLPKDFVYTGRIIFISNLKGSEIDPTIITRASAWVDVNLTHEEVIDRMRMVMKAVHKNVPMEKKEEVLNLIDFLNTNYITRSPLSIRGLINAIDTMKANDGLTTNFNGKKVPLWQVLIKRDMLGKNPVRKPKD